MEARFFSRLVVLGAGAGLLLTGCTLAPPENAVTWGIKAGTGRLTETTPHEWQAVADKIDTRLPEVDVALSDAQAEAIVEFVQVNELDSIESMIALIECAQQDPSVVEEIQVPDGMIELFVDVEVDVDALIADILADIWV
jgi:hypothetical protein